MLEAIPKIQNAMDKQEFIIEKIYNKELKNIKLGVTSVKTDLNTSIASFNDLRTQMTSIESNIIIHQPFLVPTIFAFNFHSGNTEKSKNPNRKFDILKTRISIQENK